VLVAVPHRENREDKVDESPYQTKVDDVNPRPDTDFSHRLVNDHSQRVDVHEYDGHQPWC